MQTNKTTELLNSDQIKVSIDTKNLSFLDELLILDVVDSTNTYLLNLGKTQSSKGIICFAEQQTEARGRLGRRWQGLAYSNICCSIRWQFSALTKISGLSIAIGVMVANVLKKYGLSQGIQLKWPNDVLYNGRKLAGILIETKQDRVVIGIGMNLYLPEDADPHWISVHEITGEVVGRNRVAGLLVNELLEQLTLFESQGLMVFLEDWQHYDALIGKQIILQAGNTKFAGIMKGITEQGELLLFDDNNQLLKFSYGEVNQVRSSSPVFYPF